MERRSFLRLAVAALPLHVVAKSMQAISAGSALLSAGQGCYANSRSTPTSSSAFQISMLGALGALFVMEHNCRKTGGPPRHLHHNEDEWFYVIEGEYLVEVGSQRHRLKSGDSILGPRGVPHAWAFVGSTPGWLLRAYTPAGKMEDFLAHNKKPSDTHCSTDAALYRAWGMELLGPPVPLD